MYKKEDAPCITKKRIWFIDYWKVKRHSGGENNL